MLFNRQKKQQNRWIIVSLVISILMEILKFLQMKNKKIKNKICQKKDLVSIINDITQESCYQINFNILSNKNQEINEILNLKRDEFQRFIFNFFLDCGLKSPFPYKQTRDYGQDGFYIYNGKTYAIQVKTIENPKKKIGVDELRKFAGTQKINADKKIFICNCETSKDFISEAKIANIYIIDILSLIILIKNKSIFKLYLLMYLDD